MKVSRRWFLGAAAIAAPIAVALPEDIAELLKPRKTIFLPPRGGWLNTAGPTIRLYTAAGALLFEAEMNPLGDAKVANGVYETTAIRGDVQQSGIANYFEIGLSGEPFHIKGSVGLESSQYADLRLTNTTLAKLDTIFVDSFRIGFGELPTCVSRRALNALGLK